MYRLRTGASLRGHTLTACLLLVGLFAPTRALAYRPFISTDAAVADPKEVEIEIGYFTLERDKGENAFVIPRVVFNYGLFKNWEAVAEFSSLRAPTFQPGQHWVDDTPKYRRGAGVRVVLTPFQAPNANVSWSEISSPLPTRSPEELVRVGAVRPSVGT